MAGKRQARLAGAACAAFFAVATHGIAADRTWTGAQSAFWSDPRNWQEGVAPRGGDRLMFNPGTPTDLNNDLGGQAFGDVIFNNAAVLNGSPLTVTDSVIGFAMFATTTTVNVPVTFFGEETIGFGKGSYVLSKDITAGGQLELFGNDTTLDIQGTVTASSFSAINMKSLKTGTIAAFGDYSFKGATLTTTTAGLGSGATTASISANQFNLATNGSVTRPLHLESPITGGTMVFAPTAPDSRVPSVGSIDLLRGVHIGKSMRLEGALTGIAVLDVDGGATLTLHTSQSPFVGPLTVAANGGLVAELDGALPAGATLAVDTGGRLDIGATSQHVHAFGCTGTLAMRLGAAFHTGSAGISGCTLELVIPADAGSAPGGVPLILNDGADAVSGTFNSLPEGATVMVNGVARKITYQGGDGDDVMLLPAELQDMWWAGPAESGWGMSLIQHDDHLFSVIFAYDNLGKPIWYVMPTGAWDANRASYSGSIYTPHGSPYYAYAAANLIVGNPVGTMNITVQGDSQLLVSYTIAGVSAVKTLVRQPFGPQGGTKLGDRGDMWWGGASQNGWGIAILEQAPTIFPIWYTYDENGDATWFVVPVGSFAASKFQGRAYTTTAGAWLGVPFDASRVRATDVGVFNLDFNGDAATLTYSIGGHDGTLPLVKEPF